MLMDGAKSSGLGQGRSRPVDYSLTPTRAAPPGYPAPAAPAPFVEQAGSSNFETRRAQLLEHRAATPSHPYMKAPYHELARMAAGGTPHLGVWEAALDFIDARRDCSDFVLHAVLRWLLQFPAHPALAELEARAWRTVLAFKYWPDEPGVDSLCSWTENHQILFASAAYVAGRNRPGELFGNSGQSGKDLAQRHRRRIERWLALRFRTGFSEWLSNVYYDEDIAALLTLIDFGDDEELGRRAAMVLDLILLDVALNQFHGVFGSTHGRSYEDAKKWAHKECTSDLQRLAFGAGAFGNSDSMSAVCLALSQHYRMPQVLAEIAGDSEPLRNRQRMGIRVREAERWGLGFDNYEDGMVWLSLEAYTHPRTIDLFIRMLDAYGWWQNRFFSMLDARRRWLGAAHRLGLLPLVARLYERDVTRGMREEVDICTYRTADYMLSSAQDHRFGYGGDQQHVWQATLGPDAVCFTTHPGGARGEGMYSTPNYWTGSGTLPRVAQVDNVVITVYEVSTRRGLYFTNRMLFTHAWLPRDCFDEVRERAGWIFARRGDGYLGLRSQHPYRWQDAAGEDQRREVIADGTRNIWICELGRRADDGSFEDFVARIAAASIEWSEGSVVYQSPSQGRLEWGAHGALRRNGVAIDLGVDQRYDNRFVKASFPAERVRVEANGHWLELDWRESRRFASAKARK
jgi:hypothetical protein